MADLADPTLPQVIITIDPDLGTYHVDYCSIPLEIWLGVLTDLVQKAQAGDLPTEQSSFDQD
jgi:hypothetical protein